ncbi:MAG: response regulator transcription factor [Flavobacteriales bacterium]|nr:response regulator transcription factor [Flavobacteriales bacterium]
MRIVIIEDEARAASYLERLIHGLYPDATVMGKLPSVEEAVAYFKAEEHPDLIMSDIQLADGLSFEIFEQIRCQAPVIFTTAYNQYAIQAFKNNGIDYLLKPVDPDELKSAMDKALRFTKSNDEGLWDKLTTLIQPSGEYRKRFMISAGAKIKVVPTEEVVAIYSMQKATFIHTASGRSYAVDQTLDSLTGQLNPSEFFRVSRSAYVSVHGQKEIIQWTTSRLKIEVPGLTDTEIIVARERTKDFKSWLDQ